MRRVTSVARAEERRGEVVREAGRGGVEWWCERQGGGQRRGKRSRGLAEALAEAAGGVGGVGGGGCGECRGGGVGQTSAPRAARCGRCSCAAPPRRCPRTRRGATARGPGRRSGGAARRRSRPSGRRAPGASNSTPAEGGKAGTADDAAACGGLRLPYPSHLGGAYLPISPHISPHLVGRDPRPARAQTPAAARRARAAAAWRVSRAPRRRGRRCGRRRQPHAPPTPRRSPCGQRGQGLRFGVGLGERLGLGLGLGLRYARVETDTYSANPLTLSPSNPLTLEPSNPLTL